MPPISVYRGGILFSALISVSYIIRKVFESTIRNRFRLSVCTTIFKRIAGFCFYLKCDVIHQWIHLNELYKLMESFFLNFGIIFRISYNCFRNAAAVQLIC